MQNENYYTTQRGENGTPPLDEYVYMNSGKLFHLLSLSQNPSKTLCSLFRRRRRSWLSQISLFLSLRRRRCQRQKKSHLQLLHVREREGGFIPRGEGRERDGRERADVLITEFLISNISARSGGFLKSPLLPPGPNQIHREKNSPGRQWKWGLSLSPRKAAGAMKKGCVCVSSTSTHPPSCVCVQKEVFFKGDVSPGGFLVSRW